MLLRNEFTQFMARCNQAERLYVANPLGNSIEVLDEKTGAPLASIPLGAGNSLIRLAADYPKNNRLNALVQTASGTQLFVIQDGMTK